MRLPPYQERPNEDLLEKCERIKREIQAAIRAGRAANDNEAPDTRKYWWSDD